MANLGYYQKITAISKKVGGLLALGGLVFVSGAVSGVALWAWY